MQVQPDLNLLDEEKEILKSCFNATDSERSINSEIARKEFASLVNLKFKPYFKNSDDFKASVACELSFKQFCLLFILPFLMGTAISLLAVSNVITDTRLFILGAIVYFISISIYLMVKEKNMNIFSKFKISLSKKSNLMSEKFKVLSYFAVFLENDWKPNLFTVEEKQKIFNSLYGELNNRNEDEVQKIYAEVIWKYYVDEGFAKAEEPKIKKSISAQEVEAIKKISLDFKKEIFFSK